MKQALIGAAIGLIVGTAAVAFPGWLYDSFIRTGPYVPPDAVGAMCSHVDVIAFRLACVVCGCGGAAVGAVAGAAQAILRRLRRPLEGDAQTSDADAPFASAGTRR
jgi:hypothetical protein